MKTRYIIRNTMVAIVLLFNLAACEEDLRELDKGSTPLALSVSEEKLEINQYLDEKIALSFEWTSGTNQGTNAAISYLFEMDLKNNDFANGMKLEVGKTDSRIVSYTHKELNDLLLDTWQLPVEQEAEFEARVTATVAAENVPTQVSEVITFKLTPYKYRILNLWIIGSAAPNGWENQKATPMNPDYEQKGYFSWNGMLKQGELKFLTALGKWLPSLNRDPEDDNRLVYRLTEEDPDEKFIIPVTGMYRIELNVDDLTISITNTDGEPPYAALWLVGEAAASNSQPMERDNADPFLFTYSGNLTIGKFQIASAGTGVDCDIYQPTIESPILASSAVELIMNGSPANNYWNVSAVNKYTLKLDLRNKFITISEFTPFENIWMIGDATSGGWSWDNVVAMTQNPLNKNEFTYEGRLNIGEIKFPVEIDHSWNGKFIVATYDGAPITETAYLVAAGIDNKWKITEAGDYKIVINVYKEEIHFTLTSEPEPDPSPYPRIWMIGDATPGGWSWDDVTELQRNPNNREEFIYEGPLQAGEVKFPVELDYSWNGMFIVPTYDGAPITESNYLDVAGIDNKWKIDEAGDYRIVINTVARNINFIRN